MQVIWNPADKIHCFLNPSLGIATAISENFSDSASGKCFGDILTVVVDEGGNFCDLEVRINQEDMPSGIGRRVGCEVISAPFATEIRPSDQMYCLLSMNDRQLEVKLNEETPLSWKSFSGGNVLLGLTNSAVLSRIIFWGAQEDADGTKEAAWLSEIRAKLTGGSHQNQGW